MPNFKANCVVFHTRYRLWNGAGSVFRFPRRRVSKGSAATSRIPESRANAQEVQKHPIQYYVCCGSGAALCLAGGAALHVQSFSPGAGLGCFPVPRGGATHAAQQARPSPRWQIHINTVPDCWDWRLGRIIPRLRSMFWYGVRLVPFVWGCSWRGGAAVRPPVSVPGRASAQHYKPDGVLLGADNFVYKNCKTPCICYCL